ncbi:hypothetical protein [Streptomyces sp. NPDC055134]
MAGSWIHSGAQLPDTERHMAPDDDLFQPVKPVRAYQRVAQQIE